MDREQFLRAIFASPEDDLPRLVFADYLDEQSDQPGDDAWAKWIRHSIAWAKLSEEEQTAQEVAHANLLRNYPQFQDWHDRGFAPSSTIEIDAESLNDAEQLSHWILYERPHWYGATKLKVVSGLIMTPEPLRTLLTLPAFENITALDISGKLFDHPIEPTLSEGVNLAELPFGLFEVETKPMITVRMVEELAEMRECRRLVELDLRNNELDNDAIRALADSKHFIRLRHLALSEGNRFKGRTWQRVIERFGQDVVL